MTEHGAFHWNELITGDVQQAKDFYGKSLGWSFEDLPMGPGNTYTIIKANGKMVGGIIDKRATGAPAGMPDNWFTYVAVDDVDARLRQARANGGKVMREAWDVPGVGRIGVVVDPGGAAQGWMTPAPSEGM